MTDLAMSTTVSRDEQILATDLGEEVVMMNLDSGEYYNLKGVAFRIWEIIENPTTLGDIVDTLRGEYQVDQKTCEKEVNAFARDLHEAGVLVLR